ncbi:hypothetical protein CLV59_10898 [Chitinophaga dinghuensis]|uniref:Uncharacterized protein n=1 Tax=Chitinophaga dinghuensis TaxID=1539050 RepID=A0A327VR74_9BACT|nr:hypothetical protein [Chitinophaga dinghuensis]RAJ76579.1 hypothetical protein CLV59_10898 [Chitinophaga dinghuensis]
MEKLQREVRFLKIYALALTTVLIGFLFMAFRTDFGKQRFEEIDVERINVVEKDGTLKLVISNGARQHPGLAEGKQLSPRKREPGMIFFNSAGDECGGLVYDATKEGGAGMVFSVDQYRNDQIMQLQYSQEIDGGPKYRSYGLKMWDRRDDITVTRVSNLVDSLNKLKDKEAINKGYETLNQDGTFGVERLFVGKNTKDEVGLFIRDNDGKPRIKIYIDKNNKARIVTLDEKGQVEQSVPAAK